MRVRAFAKINLSLRVLGTRADGYHELRTIFQSIALHDTLTVRAVPGPFRLTCDDPGCPGDETNLVWRAAERSGAQAGAAARRERRGRPAQADSDRRPGLAAAAATPRRRCGRSAALWRVDEAALRAIGGEAGRRRAVFLRRRHGARARARRSAVIRWSIAPAAWVVLVLPDLRRQHEGRVWLVGREPMRRLRRSAGATDARDRPRAQPGCQRLKGPLPRIIRKSPASSRRSGAGAEQRRCRAAARPFSACSRRERRPCGRPRRSAGRGRDAGHVGRSTASNIRRLAGHKPIGYTYRLRPLVLSRRSHS